MFSQAQPLSHSSNDIHQHAHVQMQAFSQLGLQSTPHAAMLTMTDTFSTPKRKRNTNTLEKRIEIIGRIERKEITQAEGARLLGVGKAAVSR
jgi:Trp operon repressor